MNPNVPGDQAKPGLAPRRYPQAFRHYADAALTEAEEDPAEWPAFVLWTSILAILLVGAIRVFQAWLVESRSTLVSWLAVIPGSLLALLCIGVLLWVFWSIHRAPGQPRPYVVAMLTVSTTILICTETFAGLTTLLWERGVVGAGNDREPGLWAAEEHYLWNLANAVPLVDAPQTVGWQEPGALADRSSGIVLFVFKILVLFPLVQVAIAGYRFQEARWLAAGERQGPWHRLLRFSGAGEAWALCAGFAFATALAYVSFALVGEPTSVVDRWANAHLADGINALGVHIRLSWLQTAADCALALAFLSLCWTAVTELGREGLLRLRSLRALAGGLCGCLALLALAIVTAAGITLALLHVEFAEARPTVPAHKEFDAAIEWHVWHVAEAIPFFDIPSSLDWSLRYEFVDHWSGSVLLALKLFFFLVVLVPVAWLVRAAVHRLRPPAAPQLDAFHELAQLLRKIQSELDDLQASILADKLRRDRELHRALNEPLFAAPLTPGESQAYDDVYPRLLAAQRRIGVLEPPLERVHALFGGGDVSQAADAAVSAAVKRLETLDRNHWTPWPYEQIRRDLEAAQTEAGRGTADFISAAAAALHEVARFHATPPEAPMRT